jgi:hypothetical protein
VEIDEQNRNKPDETGWNWMKLDEKNRKFKGN